MYFDCLIKHFRSPAHETVQKTLLTIVWRIQLSKIVPRTQKNYLRTYENPFELFHEEIKKSNPKSVQKMMFSLKGDSKRTSLFFQKIKQFFSGTLAAEFLNKNLAPPPPAPRAKSKDVFFESPLSKTQ